MLKRVADVVAGQSPPSDQVTEFDGSGMPFLQGNAEFGRRHPTPIKRCDSSQKKCLGGDILLSVRAPVGALNIADRPYGIGRGLCAIRARNIDRRFLWWCLNANVEALDSVATGSTYDAVTRDDVGALRLELPSSDIQLAIADYLDAETARIDALIVKKQRMVELIEERVWLWASDFISNRNRTLVPLRRFITRISDGPFGSSLTSAHYTDAGARVVRLGNIGFFEFKNDDEAFISITHYLSLLKHRVREGNLLIAGLGDSKNHVGRACVAPDLGPSIVKADCYCAEVDTERATPEFLAIYLSCPLGAVEVALASRGSTRSRINLDIALGIGVPTFTVNEQIEFVTGFDRLRDESLEMVRRLQKQVALLQERRQALITAAVTGQIDIPEVD